MVSQKHEDMRQIVEQNDLHCGPSGTRAAYRLTQRLEGEREREREKEKEIEGFLLVAFNMCKLDNATG